MLKENFVTEKTKSGVLTADVFESTHKNVIKDFWDKANDIEITLDFLKFFEIFKK